MEFYDSALVVLNRPCGDPHCGLLHPEIVECETVGVVVHEDQAMIAVVQKKGDMFLALVLEPYSIGYLPEQDERLCIVLSSSEREPLMLNGPDLDKLKETLVHDAGYIHGVLFGRVELQQGGKPPSGTPIESDEEPEPQIDDVTGLAALDPDKMHKA